MPLDKTKSPRRNLFRKIFGRGSASRSSKPSEEGASRDVEGHGRPSDSENPPAYAKIEQDPSLSHQDVPTAQNRRNDLGTIATELDAAARGVLNMSLAPGAPEIVLEDVPVAADLDRTYSASLQPLRVFKTAVDAIADLHPYAKLALCGLSWAAGIILVQQERDEAMADLLSKIGAMYQLMNDGGELAKLITMQDILAQMSEQMLECARFIKDYTETRSFWERIGKNALKETTTATLKYIDSLDRLMRKFRNEAARDTLIIVHRVVDDLEGLADHLRIDGIAYAAGAGLDTSKTCLPETRIELLMDIVNWINSPDDKVPRVMWLYGVAGKGKSAIAHTIAQWSKDLGQLGSFFCFDRNREADRRHEKMFTTIARDLAHRDIRLRKEVSAVISADATIKDTADVAQQWQKLIFEPLLKLASVLGPVVIVIDALDESGRWNSRQNILRVLADPKLAALPSNCRIFIVSRPLPDIEKRLHHVPHIRVQSIDDISQMATEHDITLYIRHCLRDQCRHPFDEAEFVELSKRADGLFEWARLACEFIASDLGGLTEWERYTSVLRFRSDDSQPLLDGMYHQILRQAMDPSPKALTRFRSVMQQVLGILEPLPVSALNHLRHLFPDNDEHYDTETILYPLSSLLSGVHSTAPVRPLHSSFREFLTDVNRSKDFFVDVSGADPVLAFATFRIMEKTLKFNICQLESSYLHNSDVADLQARIQKYIPSHLSYSCRFWAHHLQASPFGSLLADAVQSFFMCYERVIFWLEVLSLLPALHFAMPALRQGVKFCKNHTNYNNVVLIAEDFQRFLRTFLSIISQSTPHIYISALGFSPQSSIISSGLASRFPAIPKVIPGLIQNKQWPNIQTVCSGHTAAVYSIRISADGKHIVSGSRDTTVRVWDAEAGTQLGSPLEGHTAAIYAVALSPDDKCIASGSVDNTIRLWDLEAGIQLGPTLEGHINAVSCVAFSPDGSQIVSGSHDKTVRLWDLKAHTELGKPLEAHTGWVQSVAYSRDGKYIVSASHDSTIAVWDIGEGVQLGNILKGHTGSVWSATFSPDGQYIVSGSDDKTVRIWDLDTGTQLGRPLEGHNSSISSVVFSSDGKTIVSGSHDSTIRLWDAQTGSCLGSALEGHAGLIQAVCLTPDDKNIVSASHDSTLRIWDAEAGIQPENLPGHTAPILSIALSPNGKHLVSASRDKTIRVWDVETGLQLGGPLEGHTDYVSNVTFSLDGKYIASGSYDKTIRIWDKEDGTQLGSPLEGHTGWIWALAFSPDGKYIVSGSYDKTIRFWDVKEGVQFGSPIQGHKTSVYSISFSPDGKKIVSGSQDKTIKIWDVATGSQLGNPLLGHTASIWSVKYSPDGKHIISGSDDKTIRVWDAQTGAQIGDPLKGHTGSVVSVAFSPDSKHIISGSKDKTIHVWDALTGAQLSSPLEGHTGAISSVAFSLDGKYLVAASHDKTIRIWDALACTLTQDHAQLPIQFSPHAGYALPSQGTLFDGIDSQSSNSNNLVQLNSDGWVTGPEGRLLFWVPVHLRNLLYRPRNVLVIPPGVELDLSQMVHGKDWVKCQNI